MTTDIFKNVADKKFTDFSQAVKTELKSKLANREEIKQQVSGFERIQQMKDMFSKINTEFAPKTTEEN